MIFRHAIHIFWQLKTYQMFEDMQRQIFLLDIQLRITFGNCEISASSSAVCKKETYGFYSSVGRIDDVVIHSSGEKTVPAPIEDVVMGSP